MAETDHSDLQRLVQDLRIEDANYYRQFVIWLGVGSAGAGIALTSLATRLPNPDLALQRFLPSLLAFTFGVLSASFSVLFVSFNKSWAAKHFAASYNQEEYAQAARKIPEVFSSPCSIAEEANQKRNNLIEKSSTSHECAESAWRRHIFWKRMTNAAVIISAISFVCGLSLTIVFVALGGSVIK